MKLSLKFNKSTIVFFSVSLLGIMTFVGIRIMNLNKEKRPNIIFIMTDDLSAETLSCYGGHVIQTPNLDQIANEGIRFDSCFSNKNDNAESIAKFENLLFKNGYQTAFIGKKSSSNDFSNFNYMSLLVNSNEYYNPDFKESGKIVRENGYVTDIITQKAISFLKSINKQKPFAIMFYFNATDPNCIPALRHLDALKEVSFVMDDKTSSQLFSSEPVEEEKITQATPAQSAQYGSFNGIKQVLNNTDRMTNVEKNKFQEVYQKNIKEYNSKATSQQHLVGWNREQYMRMYFSSLLSLDENIGRLMRFLEETGEIDNTIIVYSSQLKLKKVDKLNSASVEKSKNEFRVPLLVRFPVNIKPHSVSKFICQNNDLIPTLLDLTRIVIPGNINGKTLKPIFETNDKNGESLSLVGSKDGISPISFLTIGLAKQ